jgi:hypothetical protein
MLSPLGSEPDSQLPRSHQKDAGLATSVDAERPWPTADDRESRVLCHRVISLPVADEIPVQRRGGEKRRVIADPGGRTVQDEYPTGLERGTHPVRDDDQRARPGSERGLGLRCSDGIKMARRLVEDGQPGGRQVCPGHRDELAFACGGLSVNVSRFPPGKLGLPFVSGAA